MLKRSQASKEQLCELATTAPAEHAVTSKSSSEGFSAPEDNTSSFSTSIEENTGEEPQEEEPQSEIKRSIHSASTVMEEGRPRTLNNYQIREASPAASPAFKLEIPQNTSVTIDEDRQSPAYSNVDPTSKIPLKPAIYLQPEINVSTGETAQSTTDTTTTGNSMGPPPSVVRHNTFPQSSNDLLLLRQSIMSTTTDRSSIAKFNDIDTIKIPDRYQKAEASIKRHSSTTTQRTHASVAGSHGTAANATPLTGGTAISATTTAPGFTNMNSNNRRSISHTQSHVAQRGSKSASTIIPKKKTNDLLYHIPNSSPVTNSNKNSAVLSPKQKLSEIDCIKVYDLVTGIRSCVSRYTKLAPTELVDHHFHEVTKLIFEHDGNSQAPPTKYEFKFKDYSPEVFRDLRSMFGINQAEYLMSFEDEVGVRQYGSTGKSGSSFYYSNDQKFIIKTVHHSEHLHLRRILKQYYYHVKKNPNTLLCQFYGLHRLKVPTPTGSEKIHILVMNNIFPPNKKMHKKYDLKGSTLGRKSKAGDSCGKDLNFMENHEFIELSNEKKAQLENQLKNDVKLLEKLNIMDYSFLLGIHQLSQGLQDEHKYGFSESVDEHYKRNKIMDTNGGIRALGSNGELLDKVYYIGIIDCLTNYSTKKRLETFFRSLKYDKRTISAIPPSEYSSRFYKFIIEAIRTPDDQNKKKGNVFKKFQKGIRKNFKHD